MYALVKPHFSQFGETGICPGWGAIPRPRPRRPVPRASPSAKFFRPPSEKKKNLIHIKSWGRGGAGEGDGMGRRGWEEYWGVEKLKRGKPYHTPCVWAIPPLTIWPPHPDMPPKSRIEKNQSKSAQPSVITSAGILGVRGGGAIGSAPCAVRGGDGSSHHGSSLPGTRRAKKKGAEAPFLHSLSRSATAA